MTLILVLSGKIVGIALKGIQICFSLLTQLYIN